MGLNISFNMQAFIENCKCNKIHLVIDDVNALHRAMIIKKEEQRIMEQLAELKEISVGAGNRLLRI